jgi:hypothetical protein
VIAASRVKALQFVLDIKLIYFIKYLMIRILVGLWRLSVWDSYEKRVFTLTKSDRYIIILAII